MPANFTVTQPSRIVSSIALVALLVAIVVGMPVTTGAAMSASASDSTPGATIELLWCELGWTYWEINQHSEGVCLPGGASTETTTLQAKMTTITFERMKFVEMNGLPGDTALVPPRMETNAGRQ